MDNKTWLWRKRSSEKTIVATNKFNVSVKAIGEEGQKLPIGTEVGPVGPVRNLNEKLASVLLDCHAKDDLVKKQENLAPDANAGQEKAEAVCLKRELEALGQEVAANERLKHSGAALKQCMQQLSSFREEQEQQILDAVMMASSEFEKAQKKLEEKLMETTNRLANVAIENTNLSNALLIKDKLVEELHKRASQTVAEFNALMARLDSTEKENAFLKYEYHMLEKELGIRNEELEYIRRSADATRRQHLESVKKITKLEAECQRLRILVRKRLPGPVALAMMKNEVEMMERDSTELRRKLNPTRDLILRDNAMEKTSDIPVQNIDFLIEQLRAIEEENKTLKEIMTKKNAELQSSRNMFSRTASRLSQVQARLIELSGGRKSVDLTKYSSVSKELQSPIAGSDISSDDRLGSSGSWANALISELENFTELKIKHPLGCKSIEISDMSLMDDFVEMEKLAIVSTEATSAAEDHHLSAGKEMVPVVQGHFGNRENRQEIHSKDTATYEPFDWLQNVLNAIFKQQSISKQSIAELLDDIKIALGYINHPNGHEANTAALSSHPTDSDIRGYITWKTPNTSVVELGASGTLQNQSSCLCPVASSHYQNMPFRIQCNLQEENKRLKDELNNMESANKEIEARLQSAADKMEALMMQVRESEKSIESLQAELETLKESKGMIEEQAENQKSVNEDLDTQLTVTKAKLNEVLQNFSSLEVELEDRSNCCEELEATCLELQLQLESAAKKETQNTGMNEGGKQPQNGWEITAASVKLAECQETILNLGKQLKALASPREAALFDKVFSAASGTTTAPIIKNLNRRFSLRDQMLAEDRSKAIILRSSNEDEQKPSVNYPDNSHALSSPTPNAVVCTPEPRYVSKQKAGNAAARTLAIVPTKKRCVGFLRRLLMRRNKGGGKKPQYLTSI